MRLPFISHRRALAAVAVATEASHHIAEDADKRWAEERDARLEAEAELAFARKKYRTRLARALHAVATLRAEAAVQRRVIRHLTNQLLDATGYVAEPLTDAARTTLGLDKEDA